MWRPDENKEHIQTIKGKNNSPVQQLNITTEGRHSLWAESFGSEGSREQPFLHMQAESSLYLSDSLFHLISIDYVCWTHSFWSQYIMLVF